MFVCCILGLLPVFVTGTYFYHDIQKIYLPEHITYHLIAGSIVLIISELLQSDTKKVTNIYQINYYQASIIGFIQCFSLFPGISRLGITVATGLILGFTRKVAFEFSLILFIVIACGTFIIDTYKNFSFFIINAYLIVLSIFTSFLVSFFLGKFLIPILYRTSLIFFAIYRLLIAYIIFILINY
nr:undecaprenyl-diphosphate phosphatase [Wigglesworthia glossinidia]